jgi:RNA polymerase sigma factor (TIGR02999 family)
MNDMSQLLAAVGAGDAQAAEQLLPLVYEELRKLAAARLMHERPGQTLQATALVHEAYLRLVDQKTRQAWDNRGHFFAAAAEAMRRILIEQARRKAAEKRGGNMRREDLPEIAMSEADSADDLLALDDALRQLAIHDPLAARLVQLRYFAGLTTEQAAEALGVSARSAYYTWAYAKSWLHRAIGGDGSAEVPPKKSDPPLQSPVT